MWAIVEFLIKNPREKEREILPFVSRFSFYQTKDFFEESNGLLGPFPNLIQQKSSISEISIRIYLFKSK